MLPRTTCIAAIALLTALPALAQDEEPATAQPESLEERVSYSFGLNIGMGLQKDGIIIDFDHFLEGLKHGTTGADPLMTVQDLQATMQEFQQARTAQQAAAGAENKALGDAFLADNKEKDGVIVTASGLQYKILTEGDGPKPAATDTVNVHYVGTLLDGTEFDASRNRGPAPASFPVNRVIPGWTEGLQLMSVGSKYMLYIPSELAYKDSGQGGIPPNSTLTFEVELISIDGQ
jgi:FKBP-type peptidyl-prolyl cis-trans isomerase